MAKTLYKTFAVGGIAVFFGVCSANSEETRLSAAPSSSGLEAAAQVKEGRSLFNQACAHCHGPDASVGQPERNLRRLRVRYGSDMHDVFMSTVMNGRIDKGMPVWNEVLDSKTIDTIYSYLETVQDGGE
jgi:mono/diheme cytochrome c family protein